MRRRDVIAALLGGAIAIMLAGGIAWAAIPGDGGVIQGCYTKIGGILRVIDTAKGEHCLGIELPISWNQKGPPGKDGTNGTKGTNGKDGKDGADGAPGPQRPQGPSGTSSVQAWGEVSASGVLVAGSGGITVTKSTLGGQYFIHPAFDPGPCAILLTTHAPVIADYHKHPLSTVEVEISDPVSSLTGVDVPFSVVFFC
jgi:hypothetical protein